MLFNFICRQKAAFRLATAAAAAIAECACSVASAAAIIVAEEENKDDEKNPVVIASAHKMTSGINVKWLSTAFNVILCC